MNSLIQFTLFLILNKKWSEIDRTNKESGRNCGHAMAPIQTLSTNSTIFY